MELGLRSLFLIFLSIVLLLVGCLLLTCFPALGANEYKQPNAAIFYKTITLPALGTSGIVTNTSGGTLGTETILPGANGGTNSSIALNNNRVVVSSGGTIGELGSSGTSGYLLTSNGAGSLPTWQAAPASGVTSVSLADGSTTALFSISGSPITSTGTLTFTAKNQSANTVLSGPSSGGATNPTFRSLVSADIPDISATYLKLTGGTMSGAINMGSNKINSVTDPTSTQDAATKNYVDTQLAQLNPAASVYAASTVNIPGTYTNAVSGVCIGDTFQETATVNPFVVDGATPSVGSRVLLKNQTSSFQDGVWTLTTQAVGGVSGAIFTRALDFDSTADINAGSIVPVVNGGQAGSSWYQTAIVTTCNTSSQTWTQFQQASSAYLLASGIVNIAQGGTNSAIALNNNRIVVTSGGTIGEMSSNGASGTILTSNGSATTPSFQTNAPAATNITGTLAVAHGGTNSAITLNNNRVIVSSGGTIGELASNGASGQFLSSNGNAAPTWATGLLASNNLSDVTSSVSAFGAIAPTPGTSGNLLTSNGSAWLSSPAMGPMTTVGDMIYASGSSTPARLTIGAGGSVLMVSGGIPSWASASSSPYAWSGAQIAASSNVWSNSSATFADLTNNSISVSLTQYQNSNFGTVTMAGGTGTSALPGIVFTPPIAGYYYIKASTQENIAATTFYNWRLWDGTAVIDGSGENYTSAGNPQIRPVVLSGLLQISSLSSKTISIQGATGGTSNLGRADATSGTTIEWTIFLVSPNLSVQSGATTAVVPNTTKADFNSIYLVNTSGNTVAMTMPNPANRPINGASIEFKDRNGTFQTNALTIAPFGSETFDGVSGNQTIKGKYQDTKWITDGTNWFSSIVPENLSARYVGATAVTTISPNGTVAGAGIIQVQYTTKDFDDNLNYNATGGIYTCPVTGKYEVTASVGVTAATASAAAFSTLFTQVAGVIHSGQTVWFATAATKPIVPVVSDMVNCTAGQTISTAVNVSAGTTPAINASNATNFIWIRKLGN